MLSVSHCWKSGGLEKSAVQLPGSAFLYYNQYATESISNRKLPVSFKRQRIAFSD